MVKPTATMAIVLAICLASNAVPSSQNTRSKPHISKLFYDDDLCIRDRDVSTVVCGDGDNGLKAQGYTTLGSIPGFPALAGLPHIQSNNPDCGTCFELYYSGTGRNLPVVVVTGTGTQDSTLCGDEFMELTGFNRNTVPDDVEVEIRALPADRCHN